MSANQLRDSSVNLALIAIAQEIAELLKQAYPVQANEIDGRELPVAEYSYEMGGGVMTPPPIS